VKVFTQFRTVTAAGALGVVALLAPTAQAAVDTTPPVVNLNGGLFFKVGSVLSDSTLNPRITANLTWGASDDTAITRQEAYGYVYDANYNYVSSAYTSSTSARQLVLNTFANGYTEGYVYAYDAAGNYNSDSDSYYSRLVQQGAFNLGAGWSTNSCNCWSGGTAIKSTRAGATAQYQFTGNSIAVIGDYAARRGNMQVYIDNVLQSTVSTAGATKNRVVIFQKRFKTSQTHTIKLVSASAARVDIDGLIVQS